MQSCGPNRRAAPHSASFLQEAPFCVQAERCAACAAPDALPPPQRASHPITLTHTTPLTRPPCPDCRARRTQLAFLAEEEPVTIIPLFSSAAVATSGARWRRSKLRGGSGCFLEVGRVTGEGEGRPGRGAGRTVFEVAQIFRGEMDLARRRLGQPTHLRVVARKILRQIEVGIDPMPKTLNGYRRLDVPLPSLAGG